MLETDQAWEVFEKLEDCYFKTACLPSPEISHPYKQRLIIHMENGLVTHQRPVLDNEHVCTIEAFLDIARKTKYVVIHQDDLLKKLAS